MERSRHGLRAALVTAALCAAGSQATAQHEAWVEPCSFFMSASSTLGVEDWNFGTKQGFCGGGWACDTAGSLTVTTQRMDGSIRSRNSTGGGPGCGFQTKVTDWDLFIRIPDLEFYRTDGQPNVGTVTVTLPATASLLVTGDDDPTKTDGGTGVLTGISQAGLFQQPYDWGQDETDGTPIDRTYTTDVTLGFAYNVTFWFRGDLRVSPDPDYSERTLYPSLTLGDPLTNELFVLPPGVSVRAPSVDLHDNVIGGSPAVTDLGSALAGTFGEPEITWSGPVIAGTSNRLDLGNAAPFAPASLVIGLSRIDAPFKGGVLVPNLDILLAGLPTDGAGELNVPVSSWPVGVPLGTPIYVQMWIPDPGAAFGFSASNALELIGH